jgi:hypothetical protein
MPPALQIKKIHDFKHEWLSKFQVKTRVHPPHIMSYQDSKCTTGDEHYKKQPESADKVTKADEQIFYDMEDARL